MQIVNDSILATQTSLFLAFPEDLAPPNPPPIRRAGFTHHDRLSSIFFAPSQTSPRIHCPPIQVSPSDKTQARQSESQETLSQTFLHFIASK
jgi:hypothetical protein